MEEKRNEVVEETTEATNVSTSENTQQIDVEEVIKEDAKPNEKETNDKKEANVSKKDSRVSKKLLSAILAVCLTACVAIACVIRSNSNKAYAQEHAFDDVKVEAKDETIALTKDGEAVDTKELIDISDEGTTIKEVDVEKIDTTQEGQYVVTYTLEKEDSLGNIVTKVYKEKFNVVSTDTEAPVITFKKDKVTITVGDDYDAKKNIKYVKDAFDGEITDYTIDDSKLDTSKAGTYKITVTAKDSTGNEASETFKVKVKNADSTNKSNTSSSSSSSSSSKTSSNASSTNKSTGSTSKKTTTNSNSSTASKNNSSSTSTNKSNTSSSSSSSANSTPKQTCSDVWVQDSAEWDEQVKVSDAQYQTVHHDATGHYENTYANVEKVICNGCGAQFDTYDAYAAHRNQYIGIDDTHTYHVGYVQVATGQQWVQDSAAWDEQVKVSDAQYKTVHHDATGHYETVCS